MDGAQSGERRAPPNTNSPPVPLTTVFACVCSLTLTLGRGVRKKAFHVVPYPGRVPMKILRRPYLSLHVSVLLLSVPCL